MTMRRARLLAWLSGVAVVAATAVTPGFVTGASKWPSGQRVDMHLQLGTSPQLSELCRDWNECFEQAIGLWTPSIPTLPIRAVRASTVAIGENNGQNNVIFSDTVFGDPFDRDVLAITLSYRIGDRRVESDVVFNQGEEFDAYHGPLRSATDFRRVAAHEFGHVLGLSHPDTAGQAVQAIMNSRVSNIETPTADDIAGVMALYAASSPAPRDGTPIVVNFPPRDQSLAFRNRLETKYATDLRRQPGPSFVDIEGSVVWTQEYLRYRVNKCSHADAMARVFSQIDGQGIQPVCGFATGTAVDFPPRDQSFAFRQQLETKYKDGLRRSPSQTAVDTEGDIVWTQEYLRYRVNSCSHDQAVARVLQQIDGGGIPATCR